LANTALELRNMRLYHSQFVVCGTCKHHHVFPSFFLCFLVWPHLLIRYMCAGLLLHLVTLNDIHTLARTHARTRTVGVMMSWRGGKKTLFFRLRWQQHIGNSFCLV